MQLLRVIAAFANRKLRRSSGELFQNTHHACDLFARSLIHAQYDRAACATVDRLLPELVVRGEDEPDARNVGRA